MIIEFSDDIHWIVKKKVDENTTRIIVPQIIACTYFLFMMEDT